MKWHNMTGSVTKSGAFSLKEEDIVFLFINDLGGKQATEGESHLQDRKQSMLRDRLSTAKVVTDPEVLNCNQNL